MMRAAAYVYAHAYPDYQERKSVSCTFLLRTGKRVIQNHAELQIALVSRFEHYVSTWY